MIDNKLPLTKETWSNLTDEEKTIELQRIFPSANYNELRKKYDILKTQNLEGNLVFEHPVLILELIDPVLAPLIGSWMYCSGEKLQNIPMFGYMINELVFDKSSMNTFTENEKNIINDAMKIIQNKFLNTHDN